MESVASGYRLLLPQATKLVVEPVASGYKASSQELEPVASGYRLLLFTTSFTTGARGVLESASARDPASPRVKASYTLKASYTSSLRPHTLVA